MNKNPEQLARDRIDDQLTACEWTIQNKSAINLQASIGVITTNNQVYISTIQRMYSVLKGEELDESVEEKIPAVRKWMPKEPVPVECNPKLPIEFFDFIIIDECHRSIYNLWKQVHDNFGGYLIGLTATPDNRTFGFFDQNVVSDFGFEKAVNDGVLVGYDTFTIETEITNQGSKVKMGEYVDRRERLTRKNSGSNWMKMWNTPLSVWMMM